MGQWVTGTLDGFPYHSMEVTYTPLAVKFQLLLERVLLGATCHLHLFICRHFTFAKIQEDTKNFDESQILGAGGFGKVYEGEIDGGSVKFVVKKGNPLAKQCIHEFQIEIEIPYISHTFSFNIPYWLLQRKL